MKNRLVISTVCLSAAVVASPAWGFDVPRSITEARIVAQGAAPDLIQLNFKAQLSGVVANPTEADVVVTWENVGGITPCIRVLIPVGCFDADGGVGDFTACGVQMTVDFDRGPIAVSITEFAAGFVRRRNGTVRFDMNVVGANPPDDQAPAMLGILGGAAVEIAIGAGMGTSLPFSIQTMGANPPDDG
jgi:hypothetical protein